MPIEDRVAQFGAFAALSGYDTQIKETGRITTVKKEINEEIIEITGVIKGKVIYENAGTDADFSGINVNLEKL